MEKENVNNKTFHDLQESYAELDNRWNNTNNNSNNNIQHAQLWQKVYDNPTDTVKMDTGNMEYDQVTTEHIHEPGYTQRGQYTGILLSPNCRLTSPIF